MSSDQIDNVASPDSSNNRAMIVNESNTNSLDQLFNVLSQPQTNSTPMKQRQLPRTFYIPPPKQNLSATLQHNAIHKHSISLPTQLYPNSPGSPASGEDVMSVGRGPLPPGWEMASTQDGRTYFLNHNDKTTQWEDPRKTIARQQQPFPLNPSLPMQTPHSPQHHPHSPVSGGLHGHHQQQASLPVQQQQQQQQQQQNMGPLPPGWEQAVTPEGETYFLNHIERKTSWFDPRMVHHQHSHSFNPPPNHLPQHVQHVRQSSQPHATSTQQWKQLQMEKEHLRQRHQELLHQERILKKYNKDDSGSGGSSNIQLQGDPYLHLATSEHARQASTDSGLGGATPFHPDPSLGEEMSDMDTTGTLRFSPYHNVEVRGPPNHNVELAESSNNIEGDPVLDSSMDTHLQPSIGSEFLEMSETSSSLYWV